VSHTFGPDSAVFDEDNLVSCAGLVPVMALAEQAGLSPLLDNNIHITSTRVKSGAANPVPKLVTLIAAMCAGADFIDDVDTHGSCQSRCSRNAAGSALAVPWKKRT
jgi:hypothetical protein